MQKYIDISRHMYYNKTVMNYIFHKDKIEKLLSDFYISTGIAATLYDTSMVTVAKSPIYLECCASIRENSECKKMCDNTDFEQMTRAKETGRTVMYACHAGLMETVTPVIYENMLIAYIQTGQFRDEDGEYSSVEKLSDTERRFGFPKGRLTRMYENVPTISRKKLYAHLNLMDVLIKSFWADGLITCNRSMISVKIEHYIDENISEKLSVEDLCGRFFVSKNALFRIFRDNFNQTPVEYITDKRLQRACGLLTTHPELDIPGVSSMCGYYDYNYFIRVFKKHMGVTPLAFRKRNGG